MNLPAPLAPWAPFLEEFPLDVAPALGALAGRLAPLLGPLGADLEAPDGEVDGYDGLARRGLPERMLLSEWLLATEAPDEWSRRAAEGELSYLQLARRAPLRSLAISAVFDAGPDALGAPRLGQLAALLVLARRAAQAGAALQWGVAGPGVGPDATHIWRDFSAASVRALLAARSGFPMVPAQLDEWREVFQAARHDASNDGDELWLIGGAHVASLARPGESVLRFDDPFEAGNYLEASVFPARGAQQSAHLELPLGNIATRLLRDPLGAAPEAQEQSRRIKNASAPQGALVWLNGNTLGANTVDGGVVVFRVPSSPRGGVAKPKHYHLENGQKIHFLGEIGGAFIAGRLRGGGMHIETLAGKKSKLTSGFYAGELRASESPLRRLWDWRQHTNSPSLLFCCDEKLFQLRRKLESENELNSAPSEADQLVTSAVVGDVRAAQGGQATLLYLTDEKPPQVGSLRDNLHSPGGFNREEKILNEAEHLGAISVAFWGNIFGSPGQIEQTALGFQASGWWLRWGHDDQFSCRKIEIPGGEFVRGVVSCPAKWSSPAFVVSQPAGGLRLIGVDWRHTIASGDLVLRVSTAPTSPYLAYSTASELVVYSLLHDVVLARWQWETQEEAPAGNP